jgi:uncharacterized membrane protein (DUF4010 family)
MDFTSIKTLKKDEQLKDQIIVQITKNQVLNFFRFLTVVSLVCINFLAFYIESPFVKQLVISQIILLLILFVKKSQSNTIVH